MSTTERAGRPATSTDVARRAGVSRSTVSNILNGNDARFPEQTRQRVLDAARELEYQPSVAGRSLVSGRSDTIVVLVWNVSFAAHFQDAVDQVMVNTRQIGANVVIRLAGETPRATSDAVSILRPLAVVDFGVLTLEARARLEERGTIVVPTLSSADGTAPADGGISAMQASALLTHEPQALWFVGLSDHERDPYVPDRHDALRAICEVEGLPSPQIVGVELTVSSGLDALERILQGPLPAGVACYNDDVALTLLAAARELDIEVPTTIAIVGVDNSPVGQMWSPRLTTIDTDLRGVVDAMALDLRARLGETGVEVPPAYGHFALVRGETA